MKPAIRVEFRVDAEHASRVMFRCGWMARRFGWKARRGLRWKLRVSGVGAIEYEGGAT